MCFQLGVMFRPNIAGTSVVRKKTLYIRKSCLLSQNSVFSQPAMVHSAPHPVNS